jgi:hypothetical protein
LDLDEFKLVASAGPDAAFQVNVHVIVRGEVEVTVQSILILDGGPSGDFIILSSFVLTCCVRVSGEACILYMLLLEELRLIAAVAACIALTVAANTKTDVIRAKVTNLVYGTIITHV